MISIVDGFNTKINIDNYGVYTIYAWERVMINPENLIQLKLPYKRLKIDNKFYNFVLDKKLVLQNITCLYHNLNDEDSLTSLDIVLKNNNFEKDYAAIQSLCGAGKRVDILSGQVLGRIFC